MKTHLVRWQKDYAEKGLVILDIDDGTQDTLDAVKESVEKSKVKFPVLWDEGGKVTDAYGIKAFPAAYLVGVDGKVLWEGVPLAGIEGIEKTIQAELENVKKER